MRSTKWRGSWAWTPIRSSGIRVHTKIGLEAPRPRLIRFVTDARPRIARAALNRSLTTTHGRSHGKQPEVHRPQPGAARADRVRRRALRRRKEGAVALR